MSDGFSFDLLSYGRAGPTRRDRLSPAQVALIGRTARRVPEVMIKVLPAGKATVRAAAAHLDYIDREGQVALETDEGQVLCSRDAAAEVLQNWDLELDELRPRSALSAGGRRPAPRLVYKVVFSMPPGTPPDKLFAAVRKFCRVSGDLIFDGFGRFENRHLLRLLFFKKSLLSSCSSEFQ